MIGQYNYKSLTLYDEEPYISNSLSAMYIDGWELVSKKLVKQSFSYKTIFKYKFRRKKSDFNRADYEVVYRLTHIASGEKKLDLKSLTLDADSIEDARIITENQFANVSGFSICEIKKLVSKSIKTSN